MCFLRDLGIITKKGPKKLGDFIENPIWFSASEIMNNGENVIVSICYVGNIEYIFL